MCDHGGSILILREQDFNRNEVFSGSFRRLGHWELSVASQPPKFRLCSKHQWWGISFSKQWCDCLEAICLWYCSIPMCDSYPSTKEMVSTFLFVSPHCDEDLCMLRVTNQSQYSAHVFTSILLDQNQVILWMLSTIPRLTAEPKCSWSHSQCLWLCPSCAQRIETLRLFGLGHCLGRRAKRRAVPLGIHRDHPRHGFQQPSNRRVYPYLLWGNHERLGIRLGATTIFWCVVSNMP